MTVRKSYNSAELRRLLRHPWLKMDSFIDKPNWFNPHRDNFTDAETLRMLLEALDGQLIVT